MFAALKLIRNMSEQDRQTIMQALPRNEILRLSEALAELAQLMQARASSFAASFATFSRIERGQIVNELSGEERISLLHQLDRLRTSTTALDVGRVIEELEYDSLEPLEGQQ